MATLLRIPLLFVSFSIAVSLTILFAAGIVVPGYASSLVWIALAVVAWLFFRVQKVALVSLSRAAMALYLYGSLALFWPILYPQVTIAVRATSFQTADIFAKANHMVAIGLAAFLAGWLLAFEWRARRQRSFHGPERPPIDGFGFMPLMLMALPIVVLAFPLDSILTVGYNGLPRERTLAAGVEINVLKPAIIICLLLALVSLFQRSTLFRKTFWIFMLSVVILILGFASGNRVEEFGCLLGVAWLFQNRQPGRRFPRRGVAIAAVLVFTMLILGEIRSVLPFHPIDSDLIMGAARRAIEVIPQSDTLMMKTSTNGDIAATLCVVIGLIDTGVLQIDHGWTFVQYLWMTLPRFANSDRPVELQVLLQQLQMTGGGLFILSEPYLAGGAVGVLIVMGLFGLLVGILEVRCVRRELTPMAFFVYLMLLSCVPRWFLYGILSCYKHMLTAALILVAAKISARLIRPSGIDYRRVYPLQGQSTP